MNVAKLLLATSIAFALGLTACSNDDDISSSDVEGKNNTNVSVILRMSQNADTRTTKSLPNDYRSIGGWAGKDKVEKVAVYLVDGTTISVNHFTVGTKDTDGYSQETNALTKEVLLRPTKTIKTTGGIKKVYVLINGTSDVIKALSTTEVSAFEAAYKNIALSLANSGANTFAGTSADKLATKNGVDSETIVMTNTSEVIINVAANVTEEQALQSQNPRNRISVGVERAVARVMVTTEKTDYSIKLGADILGSISDINWVLAQGENSLYVQRQADWTTPNSNWVPTTDEDFTSTGIIGKDSKYDYSGLFEGYDEDTQFGGTIVPTMSEYTTDTIGKITDELNTKLSGKFILPNTHAYGSAAASKYKKGNTAYILIRAKFTPRVFADGEAYNKGNDFFVGANGKFYTTETNAVDSIRGGIIGQTVTKYVGGKVLYYAWVNPDIIPTWFNSPVLRNNIYHVHITGFKNLGTNWNPLFPEDPNSATPENPDPKPSLKKAAEAVNPISPIDPLTTPETWMSVDVKVLPWTLHSYSVDLGI